MGFAAPLLAVPFLGAATIALWWISRRFRGSKVLALVVLVPVLAFGGWCLSLYALTRAQYVCVQCGRMEERWRFAELVVASRLRDDGREYTQRFTGPEHRHEWHYESCRRRGLGGVECNAERVEGWFRVLPKLSDRTTADALVAEAGSLPYRERCRLMDEVTLCVWLGAQPPGEYDAAFERWQTRRGK